MSNLILQELGRIELEARIATRGIVPRAKRFLAAFLPALITALVAAGPHLTLGLALSTAGGLAVMALGELWPTVPWAAFLAALDKARDRALPPPAKETR